MHVLTSTNDWCIGSKRACATILILWRRVVAASAPGGCVGGGPPGVGVAGPVFPPLVCVAVVCAPVALRPVDGWRLAACVVLVHAVRAVALQWCPPPYPLWRCCHSFRSKSDSTSSRDFLNGLGNINNINMNLNFCSLIQFQMILEK